MRRFLLLDSTKQTAGFAQALRGQAGIRGALSFRRALHVLLRLFQAIERLLRRTGARIRSGLLRTRLGALAGRCLTELKRPTKAITLLTAAVGRYDDTHTRELALYLSWLAEAQVYEGNIDQAADVAARALRPSAGVTSTRGTDRVRLVRRLLAPHHGTTAVDDFEEQATAILGPR